MVPIKKYSRAPAQSSDVDGYAVAHHEIEEERAVMTENGRATNSFTRRSVLGLGLSTAFPLAAFGKMLRPTLRPASLSGDRTDADLFVFANKAVEQVALVVGWTESLAMRDHEYRLIRIHAGSSSWNIELPDPSAGVTRWHSGESELLSGCCRSDFSKGDLLYKVAAAKMPRISAFEGGVIKAWAEMFTGDGARWRVGSPFLSDILRGDAALSTRYHEIAPADDRLMLTGGVAQAIASRARTIGVVHDPDAYGRRLASILLPDIVRYDPAQPSGFTFAAWNGRHLQDECETVVSSVLSGCPAVAGRPNGALQAARIWPPLALQYGLD